VCGGVGVYEVDFELTSEESTNYRQSGSAYLDQLSFAVRAMPSGFLTRGPISPPFDGPPRNAALVEWRQRHPER
jgi:hypothetical protein